MPLSISLFASDSMALMFIQLNSQKDIAVFKKSELPVITSNLDFNCDRYAYTTGADGYGIVTPGVYGANNKQFAVYKSCFMPMIMESKQKNGLPVGVFRAAEVPKTEFTIALPPSDFQIISRP